MRPLSPLALAAAGVLVLASCAPGVPQLMPKQTLFTLDLGTLEDQIDLFQRSQPAPPERDRFLFDDGLVFVSDGNARKVMEFSSYGDLLTLYYNPETNPAPALSASSGGAGTPDQVKNRRAFAHPFNEIGELAVTSGNQLYVEDRVPAERRTADPDLGAVLESRVLRFDKDGKFLDFLGQEGIGGTPFPAIEHLSVSAAGELSVVARTGTGRAVWWYDAQGNPVLQDRITYDRLPVPEGRTGLVGQLEAVFPDWRTRTIYLKVDYFQELVDNASRTAAGIQEIQSRIWTYDLTTKKYTRSFPLPVLARQGEKGEAGASGDRPYQFLGVSEAGQSFFLSSPERGSQRFLVCAADGNVLLERNIELGGGDSLFGQFSISRTGILVGFLATGDRAEVAWWRSDKLLGTDAGAGF